MTETNDIQGYFEEQAQRRAARGATPVPIEMNPKFKGKPEEVEAAQQDYVNRLLQKPTAELSETEIAQLRAGIGAWVQGRRK
jgi:hypothetical protein